MINHIIILGLGLLATAAQAVDHNEEEHNPLSVPRIEAPLVIMTSPKRSEPKNIFGFSSRKEVEQELDCVDSSPDGFIVRNFLLGILRQFPDEG